MAQMHIRRSLKLAPAAFLAASMTCGLGQAASAATYVVQHGFTGSYNDGALPDPQIGFAVVADSQGNEYGTTEEGGGRCPHGGKSGCGVVYKIDARGVFTVLVRFNGNNGDYPDSGLILKNNVLYGIAQGHKYLGDGLVFSVRTDGSDFRILHHFSGLDGYLPKQIVLDGVGNVFGITKQGGTGDDPGNPDFPYYGNGVLFEIKQDKTFITLYDFTGGSDGAYPVSLIRDSSGNLFGTTVGRGLQTGVEPTAFRYTPSTAAFTTLHVFDISTEGDAPLLVGLNNNGNLFGYSQSQFVALNSPPQGGTVFELAAKDGRYDFAKLYQFKGLRNDTVSPPDGTMPTGLAVTGHNTVVGVTYMGGTLNQGTIFQIKDHVFTTLYAEPTVGGGVHPIGNPTLTQGGAILGTTMVGGVDCPQTPSGCGMVFSFTP